MTETQTLYKKQAFKKRKIAQLQARIHRNAVSKGFWGNGKDNIPEKLALIHSEVSEALEEYRKGRMAMYWKGKKCKPEGFPVELADIIIRCLDLAEHLDINIETAIDHKMRYNAGRSYMHGGKKC